MLIWLASQIQDTHKLEIEVKELGRRCKMSNGMRVLLYQATRELLFNVVKHAAAKHATVEIRLANGTLGIDVTDDGRGFEAQTVLGPDSSEHFGLNSLHESLSLFGGSLGIESQPGGGARVRMHVPQARLNEDAP